jgi:PPOX class probable F420-dependent enzyme
MDIGDALDFVRSNPRAVVATTRAAGTAALSPVVCAVDDDAKLVISTRETAMKVAHVARDPRISLCVLNDGFFGAWCRIDGTAEVVRLPEAMELLVDYYRRLSGEHPDWDEYRAAMQRDRRVVLRITPTGAGPDVSG